MKQLMRKLTSLLLAMAMVMSFAATVAAAEESTSSSGSVDSAAVSAQSEQDYEPEFDAQDLSAETSDLVDETEEEDSSLDNIEEPAVSDDQSADESQAEADADADEPDDEVEADDELSTQGLECGWKAVRESGNTTFSLSYIVNSVSVPAKSGLFLIPEQKTVNIEEIPALNDGDPVQVTFSAGVYSFDAESHLVLDTNYPTTTTPAEVSVLDASLNLVETKSLKLTSGKTTLTGDDTNGYTVTSGAALFTGKDGSTVYNQGAKFTGFYRDSAASALYSANDGALTVYSGQMVSKAPLTSYMVGNQLSTSFDKLWYYQGTPFTGLFRNSAAPNPNALYTSTKGTATLFGGQMLAKAGTYLYNNVVTNQYDECYYVDGLPFTGFYEHPDTKLVSLLNAGKQVQNRRNKSFYFSGLMKKTTITFDASGTVTTGKGTTVTFNAYARNNKKQAKLNNKYYQFGKLFTGIPNTRPTDFKYPKMNYFKNGVAQKMKDGWYCAPRSSKEFWKPNVYYYFKNNVALTGSYKKLKAIDVYRDSSGKLKSCKYKDTKKYYYNFTMTGKLETNLLRYWTAQKGSSYRNQMLKNNKFRIYCDHTTYTGTVVMYNKKDKKTNGGWNIPVKSFVISMSASVSRSRSDDDYGTLYGNYPLSSGRHGWYEYINPENGSVSWFSGSNHIWGSGSMFHGPAYKFDGNKVKGKSRKYKLIASNYNQFGTAQTHHCVRVQEINMLVVSQLYKRSSKVRVYLTQRDTKNHMPFGHMSLLNNYDVNGYILHKTNYGYGHNKGFDPTDAQTKGSTIYISKKKTSKKSQCTKIKMTGYSGYELYYAKA